MDNLIQFPTEKKESILREALKLSESSRQYIIIELQKKTPAPDDIFTLKKSS